MDSKARIAKALKIATDTKIFEMGPGVSAMAPEVFQELFPGKKAKVIADINTWPALGEKVYELFTAAGIPTEKFIIEEEEFHAEWKYVELVDRELDGDFIALSVGSGVINDLCKLCAHHHNQQYLALPTAASVDGYSSFGASISYQNAKQTFSCPAPVAIIADIDVIAAAPKEMTAAGYADLAAKVPAGAEWMIADLMGTEPIIPDAWHVLQDVLDEMLSNPDGVANAEPQAVADLFEGLTLSGFAMQAAQSSRPASCCEHLFSHILDMTHFRFQGKLQSHGFQVAIGTLAMCAAFDTFLSYDLTKLDVDKCVHAWPTLEQEQKRALELFRDFPVPELGYTEITKKYNPAEVVRDQLTKVKKCWPEFRRKLRDQVYPFKKMHALFKAAGAPYDPSMIGVDRKMMKDMFPKVQLMRFRFNLLDLAKRAMVYDEMVDSLFAPGGVWDLDA
jgi:glycerol-1-phosphate dehydrogenase [NAD(P)+]